MTAQEKRAAVVAQAREWLGFNEADGSFREIIDLYNAGRPPGSYAMSYRDPWCAAFVSAVGMAAGCGDVILPHVNCDGMIAAYRERGQWIEDDGYQPEPGDLIFYDWQDGGAGDNRGSADHVGIVVYVDGRLIEVIEGNYSDAVKRRYIYEDGPFIRGFAVPGYADDDVEQDGDKDPSAQADASTQDDGVQDGGAEEPDAPDGAALCATLPVLSFGCCGRSVVVAQGILIALGYSCGPDGADGDFGYNTRNAVRNFQRGAGLADDGVIGPETWGKLLGVKG